MTSTITLPAGLRRTNLAWWTPLLLPVLPFLALLLSDRLFTVDQGPIAVMALTVLGGTLAIALPSLIQRCGWLVRKEAEQLRAAWLVGLFLIQCLALATSEGDIHPVAAVVFALACALVATLTFGAEFQQRTMSGLLSQPIDRRRVWAVKMRVLGLALLLQWSVFGLTLLATNPNAANALTFLLIALVAAAVAWTTTPFWTLLTRSVVAGLVFSSPVPLVGIALGFLIADAVQKFDPWARGEALANATLLVVFFGLGPLYAGLSYWGARRRWLRLETTDHAAEDTSGVFLGRWGQPGATSAGTRPGRWFATLAAKELRLQTVTLASLLLMLACRGTGLLVPNDWFTRELLSGLAILFGATTVLLAGATPLAEERRLGTLDGHVLQPISRRIQWSLKLGLAAVLALASLAAAAPLGAFALETWDANLVGAAAVLVYAFAFSLLASSALSSTLRALLLGIGITAVTGFALGLLAAVAGPWLGEMLPRLREAAVAQPELWFERARQLSDPELAVLRTRTDPTEIPIVALVVFVPAVLPVLLAITFAGRNFTRPAGAPQRLTRQVLLCLGAMLILALLTAGGIAFTHQRQLTAHLLVSARDTLDLHQKMSPAERHLKALRPAGGQPNPFDSIRSVQIDTRQPRPDPKGGPTPVIRWQWTDFVLPLKPEDRRRLIEDGNLPEPLRDELRREALAKGQTDISPPGSGRPPGPWPEDYVAAPGGFVMSPEMMRRYGLLPRSAAMGGATPVTDTPTNTPAPAAAPTFRMSPELMKRYGLVPPTDKAATNAPTNPATPANATPTHRMSPELMKRYGLVPGNAGATSSPPTNATDSGTPNPPTP